MSNDDFNAQLQRALQADADRRDEDDTLAPAKGILIGAAVGLALIVILILAL